MPPVIDEGKCTGCGTCVDICAEDVFFGTTGFGMINGERPKVTYPQACYHCSLCMLNCPSEAIWIRTPMTMMIPYKDA
jgi:adenylylsulfate reductase subunit B